MVGVPEGTPQSGPLQQLQASSGDLEVGRRRNDERDWTAIPTAERLVRGRGTAPLNEAMWGGRKRSARAAGKQRTHRCVRLRHSCDGESTASSWWPAYRAAGRPPSPGAWRLAPELGLPLIAKDTIKESFDALGTGDLEWSRQLGRAAHVVMYALAREARSAVLESHFWPGMSEAELLGLRRPLVQVYCRCPLEVALDRCHRRAASLDRCHRRAASLDRHPGHLPEHQSDEAAPTLWPSRRSVNVGVPPRVRLTRHSSRLICAANPLTSTGSVVSTSRSGPASAKGSWHVWSLHCAVAHPAILTAVTRATR
jgi:hypothetical protein